CTEAMNAGDSAALFSLFGLLRSLDEAGCLRRQLRARDRIFARLTPLTGPFCFVDEPLDVHVPRRLSRFAYLHAERGTFALDSPLGTARVELPDPIGAAVVAALAQTRSLHELCATFPDLADETLHGLLLMLQNAAVLDGEEDGDSRPGKSSATWWEFHDLVFHMRSRLGRHGCPYGGTLRLKHIASPPLDHQQNGGPVTPLARPDLERLRPSERPL